MNLKIFNGNNLPHESLLAKRQKTKLRDAFENNMPSDIKLSRISKILPSGGFLAPSLSKLAGPLMKVAVPLAKNILGSLGITAAASAIDAGIQKNIHGSGHNTTLIISNEKMNDILKIVQALEDSDFLLKRVTKTIKKETKEQKGGFLSIRYFINIRYSIIIRYFRRYFVMKYVSRKRICKSRLLERNCNSWLWK